MQDEAKKLIAKNNNLEEKMAASLAAQKIIFELKEQIKKMENKKSEGNLKVRTEE